MDPITIISSVLTIASLIQEVISLARKIDNSLSKVSQNRKRLQDLLAHINSTLEELRCLCTDEGDVLEQCSDLRRSLNFLKEEMSRILQRCLKLVPDRGLSQVKAKVKAWHKRDEIETEIAQLKEHVMSCYSKFTAFSTARIENTSIRTENALLVHRAETRFHFSHLEGLINRMLLDTDYGHTFVRDMDAHLSGAQYDLVEHQYLALQLNRLVESLQSLAAARTFRAEEPNVNHKLPFKPVYTSEMQLTDVTYLTLGLLRQVQDYPDDLSIQVGAQELQTISIAIGRFGLRKKALAFKMWITNLYQTLVSENPHAFLPHLGHSYTNLAISHENLEQHELALNASKKAVSCFRGIRESHADLDFRVVYAQALLAHGRVLCQTKRLDEALSIMQECASISEVLLVELPETFLENPELDARANAKALKEHNTILIDCLKSYLDLAQCLSLLDRSSEAYHIAKKSLSIFPRLPISEHHITAVLHDQAFENILSCMSSIYERHSLPLSLVEDILSAYRDLAQAQPTFFSPYFLQALYIYARVCNGTDSNNIVQLEGGSGHRNPFVLIWGSEQSRNPLVWDSEEFSDLSERLKRLGRFEWAKSITRDAIYALHIQDISYSVRSYNLLGIQSLVNALFMSQVNEGVDALREVSQRILSGETDNLYVIDHFMLKIQELVLLIGPVEERTKLLVISDDMIDYCRSKFPSIHGNGNVQRTSLADVLKTYSDILETFPHRQEDALKWAEESVRLYRQLDQEGVLSSPDLAFALQDLSYRYNATNRLDDAITSLQEGIAVWRRDKASLCHCVVCALQLPSALSTLSVYLSCAGRHPEAEAARAESQVLREMLPPTSVPPIIFTPTVGEAHITEDSDEEDVLFDTASSSTSNIDLTTEAFSPSPADGGLLTLDSKTKISRLDSDEQLEAFALGSPQNTTIPVSRSTSSPDLGNKCLVTCSPQIDMTTPADATVPPEGGSAGIALLRRRFSAVMNFLMICCTLIVVVNILRNQWGVDIHFSVSTR